MNPATALLWVLVSTLHPNDIIMDSNHVFIYHSDCRHSKAYQMMISPKREKFYCDRRSVDYKSLTPDIQNDLKVNDYIHRGNAQWHDN